MKNGSIHSDYFEYSQCQTELDDLLEAVLGADDRVSYPWNPADSGAEAYFAELEQDFTLDGLQPEELTARSQVLFNQLNQMWAQMSLSKRFAAHVPQRLLDTIVQQAQQVISTNLSLADQLVQCVREIMPAWDEDDLRVLARPLAYAMRGAETDNNLESTLGSVRSTEWASLSEIEQARLSLAIARYALANLNQPAVSEDSAIAE